MPIHWEIRIAGLIAAGGFAWGVYAATHRFAGVEAMQVPKEALYLTSAGVLVWLHAKWRAAMKRV